MTGDKVLKDYQTFLIKNEDKKKAAGEKAYLYSDLKHYEVPSWDRGKFLKQHDAELKKLTKKDAINLAKKAWKLPSFDEKCFAVHLMDMHSDKLNSSDMPWIEQLMRESKGWAFLDSLIIPLMPEILKKDKSAYKHLHKWINDDDFWVRRSALLSQLLFFRNNEGGNKQLFFKFARSQFDETWIDEKYPVRGPKSTAETKLLNKRAKFFIRKAIGRTLRDMSQKDPESAYKFLQENKDKMSGLSFREGSRKLPESFKKKLNK